VNYISRHPPTIFTAWAKILHHLIFPARSIMEGPPFGKAYPLEGSQWKLKISKNETNGETNKI